MKYCGVATPSKGIRVYTRSAMGMPGSETYLEELMSRVLGDLIQEGCVVKIDDDLYVGGNSPVEVLENWRRVLSLLHKNSLRLPAAKTIICPRNAILLGWVWSNGTLQAGPYKVVMSGRLPSWGCPHLPRTHSHLSQGTRPSKKVTNISDVKLYLKDVVIASDGLLVVHDHQPFQPPSERLVVPRSVLDDLLTALHIRFSHPSKYQTKRLFSRYFFALDVDKAIDPVSSSCHTCESVKSIPKPFKPQSSGPSVHWCVIRC